MFDFKQILVPVDFSEVSLEAVKAALGSLGFDGVDDVRVGRFIELELGGAPAEGEAREKVSAMCEQLLANPVIESYRVEVDPS